MASWVVQLGSAVVGGAFCFAAVGKAIEPAEVVASLTYLAGMIDAPPLYQDFGRASGPRGRL